MGTISNLLFAGSGAAGVVGGLVKLLHTDVVYDNFTNHIYDAANAYDATQVSIEAGGDLFLYGAIGLAALGVITKAAGKVSDTALGVTIAASAALSSCEPLGDALANAGIMGPVDYGHAEHFMNNTGGVILAGLAAAGATYAVVKGCSKKK